METKGFFHIEDQAFVLCSSLVLPEEKGTERGAERCLLKGDILQSVLSFMRHKNESMAQVSDPSVLREESHYNRILGLLDNIFHHF